MTQANTPSDRFQVRVLPRNHDFFCYVWSGLEYPLAAGLRDRYVAAFSSLMSTLHSVHGGEQETLLQVWKTHHDAASKEISKNGAAWMPSLGVGVWPHKEPPHIWTVDEFKQFIPGVAPRPPVFMIFRLKGERERCANVLNIMGGRGVLIYAGVQHNVEQFYRACNEYFQTFIIEPLHRAFPFFFPLVEGATLGTLSTPLFQTLFGPLHYYVRESSEDGGVLIMSRESLESFFRGSGWEIDS